MNQVIRLYQFPISPFCRKVRLVLAEKRLQVEEITERYWEGAPEFLKLNPAGTVPVLKIGSHVLAESNAICEYLDESIPDPPLLPGNAMARAEARRLVGWFDDRFFREVTRNLVGERLLKKIICGGQPESAKIKSGSRNCRIHIDYIAGLLERRRWLAGDQMTLADFAAAAQISCLDYVSDIDWERSDAVKDWYAKIKSRPAFRSILRDNLPGFPPPYHYSDLDF